MRTTEKGVGAERAVLIVRAKPLRARDEELLADEWAVDSGAGQAHTAGAQVVTARTFDAPVLEEPIGSGEIETAEVGALKDVRAGLHVVIGHAERDIVAVVVADAGQRIAGDVCAIAGRG